MNLSPGGLEDGPPGFPYFATADGKFEFGYGGPPFHPHDGPFFPGHHPGSGPGGQPMPFNQPGKFSSIITISSLISSIQLNLVLLGVLLLFS